MPRQLEQIGNIWNIKIPYLLSDILIFLFLNLVVKSLWPQMWLSLVWIYYYHLLLSKLVCINLLSDNDIWVFVTYMVWVKSSHDVYIMHCFYILKVTMVTYNLDMTLTLKQLSIPVHDTFWKIIQVSSYELQHENSKVFLKCFKSFLLSFEVEGGFWWWSIITL